MAADATKLVYQDRIAKLVAQAEALAFSCEWLATWLSVEEGTAVEKVLAGAADAWRKESARRSS